MHGKHEHAEGSASATAPDADAVAAARTLIAEEQQARMRECAAELEEVLQRYGMRLHVPAPQITIVSND